MATFGGDEIIVACAGDSQSEFKSLETLHPREKFQMLQMIQEASHPEVRAMRIAAIVSTCIVTALLATKPNETFGVCYDK